MTKLIVFLAAALTASVWLNVELLTKEEPRQVDHWIADTGESMPCFTPGQDCTQLIVDAIDAAKEQVLVQAYNYTSEPIMKAVARAKSRGLDVRLILDDSNEQERYDSLACMLDHNIPVLIDNKVKIAHSKVMIFDRRHVLRGSFNFTESAQESNAENTELTRNNPALAQRYIEHWENRASKSRPFKKPHNKCDW